MKVVCITNDVEATSIYGEAYREDIAQNVAEVALPALLALYRKYNVKATFFCLASYIQKYPQIIEMIQADGHEVACHGFTHESNEAFDMLSYEEQLGCLKHSKEILDALAHEEVVSFRAPALRVNEYTPKALKDAGFRIDSSVAPQRLDAFMSLGSKRKLQWIGAPRTIYETANNNLARKGDSNITEVPVSAFGLPYISTLMRVSPFLNRLARMSVAAEANHHSLSGGGKKVVNFLFHPSEAITIDQSIGTLQTRTTSRIKHLLVDVLRMKLKRRNLGPRSLDLLEKELIFWQKKGYAFKTIKDCSKMKIAFYLAHPAHYHYFKFSAQQLRKDGHEVIFLAKNKDILLSLLDNAGEKYEIIAHKKSKNYFQHILYAIQADLSVVRYLRTERVDMIIGSQLTGLIRRMTNTAIINTGEDDAKILGIYPFLAYTHTNSILSPICCDNGKWNSKTVPFPGFLKLAYLHPKHFSPDRKIVEQYQIDHDKPYFLIRFAKLNAHHDTGVSGISTNIAQHLIDMLRPHGQIYITSERELEPQFEQYRLHINPLDIHHVMAFATLYIGDSQSMANEAAMLGVPSLRFNDFVGAKKIGVMEELEHVYGLTYGISSHEPERLYAKVEEFLEMPNLREVFQERRQKMLSEKIDVTAFLTWFIENYPLSAKEAKNADAMFWERFK